MSPRFPDGLVIQQWFKERNPQLLIGLAALTNGKIAASGGAAPVFKGNEMVGAYGVSGGTSQQDEEIAKTPAPRSAGRTPRPTSRRPSVKAAHQRALRQSRHQGSPMSSAVKAEAWTGRVEDDALLRGQGRFGDDVKPDGALAACFVRSPHGFAKIDRIDVSAAKSAPGVVAVFTAADLAAAHYHSISHGHPFPAAAARCRSRRTGRRLPAERVMHVGEPVAMVVAQSAAAAQDAADKVVVDYTPLDAVTDVRDAIKPGAPQLWPEAPGNIGFDWTAPAGSRGQEARRARQAPSRRPRMSCKVELVNQRLVVASLEPRTATASYDAAASRFTLRCGSQAVAGVRGQVAGSMNVKPEELRVLTDDVGGAFGMKGCVLPRIRRAAARRARARQAGALGVDAVGGLRHRQPGPRIRSGRSSLRSASAAGSSACASIASATSAPISPASRISFSPRISPAACRRSTIFRTRR